MADQSHQNVDALLGEAMKSEIDAENFYRDASEKAQSQAGKKLFQELADFEHNHFEHVKSIIESRKKGEKVEPPTTHREIPPIKSEVEGEFEPNKDEIVDLLGRGIQAEKEAQTRYAKIAELLEDPEGKEIFDGLAEDERRHHDLLEAQYYHISNKGTIIWGE